MQLWLKSKLTARRADSKTPLANWFECAGRSRITKVAHACGPRQDMLCERCQEREATVHLTLVLSPADEVTRHDYCQSCYPAVEAERAKISYSQPDNPLPADVEHITALEY